jgi:hypothetical protein
MTPTVIIPNMYNQAKTLNQVGTLLLITMKGMPHESTVTIVRKNINSSLLLVHSSNVPPDFNFQTPHSPTRENLFFLVGECDKRSASVPHEPDGSMVHSAPNP